MKDNRTRHCTSTGVLCVVWWLSACGYVAYEPIDSAAEDSSTGPSELESNAATPSCSDGIQNLDEEDIDCGGSCAPCALVQGTVVDTSCRDGQQDGSEQGIDCGGFCTPCSDGNFDCATQTSIPVHECRALVALYDDTNGEGWADAEQWYQDSNPCNWHAGITCEAGHLTQLTLNGNDLLGSVSPVLGNMTELVTLSLGANILAGNIPAELTNLQKLESLDFSANALGGNIPGELESLTNLRVLRLGQNNFSGSIPTELGSLPSLENLNLEKNTLSGNIPASFGQLSQLEVLNITDNVLSGMLPGSLADLEHLRTLRAKRNELRGAIPANYADSSITSLSLYDNACLWPEECDTLKPWLDSMDADWQDNTAGNCTPLVSCP